MTFASFFKSVHGCAPFPWQVRAAQHLIEGNPDMTVAVPTAAGKTALIDAGIYAAAHGGPRRIAFIIDRRVVVDEAYQRTQRIIDRLSDPTMSVWAEKLGPMQVVRLRGGVHGDDDWVLYPDRLTVLISTVDQVGSRLLHRGYGVSPRMAPVHAGFVGNDALYIIDEAHLSGPFVETVNACRQQGADIRLVTMSATPQAVDKKQLVLEEEDHNHPILKSRLSAAKIAELKMVPKGANEFTKSAVETATQMGQDRGVIGVVVNRVAMARKIWQALTRQKHETHLLTGRVRPYDRDQLLKMLFPRIRAGRQRTFQKALYIVATQSIEVGADIDFDALVTEIAPLDSLRQRFGRLDRLGKLGTSHGAILYQDPGPIKKGKQPQPDAIYGMAIHETWNWLKRVSPENQVDFGICAMEALIKRQAPPVVESDPAPMLLASHIALLSQTGPDAPRIEISPWLHGAGSGPPDVAIVWRGDLAPDNTDQWKSAVQLFPPLTNEALQLPIYAARGFFSGKRPQDISDLEGSVSQTDRPGQQRLPLLRWRGHDDIALIQVTEMVPGDTIVVPAQYGGCDLYGWAPNSKKPVEDIAELCSLERGGKHVIRLIHGLSHWIGPQEKAILEATGEIIAIENEIDPEIGIDRNQLEIAYERLRTLLADVDHPLVNRFKGQYEIERHPLGLVLRGRLIDEIGGSLSTGVAVALADHLNGVTHHVETLADGHPQKDRLVSAARIHDLGKSDLRFQVMLHGDPFSAAAGPALAKSGFRKLTERLAAYRDSGLPKGFRHELASLDISDECDDLARYLVATHHGHGRPWFPVCHDAYEGASLTLPSGGWLDQFGTQVQRGGPWVLAGMELLLRAADARQSMLEREGDHG